MKMHYLSLCFRNKRSHRKKRTQPEKTEKEKEICVQMLGHSKGGTIADSLFPHEFRVHFYSICFSPATSHSVAVFVFSVRLWLLLLLMLCWLHCSHYLKLLSFVCAQNAVVKNLFIFRLFFLRFFLAFWRCVWPYLLALTTTTAAATVKIRVENCNGESFKLQQMYRMKGATATAEMKKQRKKNGFTCRCSRKKITPQECDEWRHTMTKESNEFRDYWFVRAIPTENHATHFHNRDHRGFSSRDLFFSNEKSSTALGPAPPMAEDSPQSHTTQANARTNSAKWKFRVHPNICSFCFHCTVGTPKNNTGMNIFV